MQFLFLCKSKNYGRLWEFPLLAHKFWMTFSFPQHTHKNWMFDIAQSINHYRKLHKYQHHTEKKSSMSSTNSRLHKQRIGGGRHRRMPSRPPDWMSWSSKDARTSVQTVPCATTIAAGATRASRGHHMSLEDVAATHASRVVPPQPSPTRASRVAAATSCASGVAVVDARVSRAPSPLKP
jgi:hypothetical protein